MTNADKKMLARIDFILFLTHLPYDPMTTQLLRRYNAVLSMLRNGERVDDHLSIKELVEQAIADSTGNEHTWPSGHKSCKPVTLRVPQAVFHNVCEFIRAHYTILEGTLYHSCWNMSGLDKQGSTFLLGVKAT